MQGSLFSESWYRVAELNVGLHRAIQAHKQYFRGEASYVLKDPYNTRFFRVTPEAYRFLMRLNPRQTIEEIWETSLRENPDETPSQDAVIRLLSQLHTQSLLYIENSPDTEAVFDRLCETRQRELTSKLQSFLFFRIPIWDPYPWLKRYEGLAHLLFSKIGLCLWLAVIATGVYYALQNPQALYKSGEGVLAPSNILLLYLCMAGIKLLHEMGHALATHRFGGEVHTMGIMFLIFTPLPYMDATSSWAFRSRWQRALVGAAGMIVELFLAAVATLVWAHTGEGLIHSLAFNIMFIGSVSSLLFNGNPLTRLDSYYILSDVLEIPNLGMRARDEWKWVFERYVLNLAYVEPASNSRSESFWLLFYGFASYAYRLLLSVGIALFVLDQWFEIGVLIVALSAWTWLLKPLKNLIRYLFFEPALEQVRLRAIGFAGFVTALLIWLGFFLPAPESIRAPAVVQARGFQRVHNKTPGTLTQVLQENGSFVKRGDELMILKNPELDLELQLLKAQIEEAKALRSQALQKDVADIMPIERRLEFLHSKNSLLLSRQRLLTVTAPSSGTWVAPELEKHIQVFLRPGSELGHIVPASKFEMIAIVSQENAYELFRNEELFAEVRFPGRAGTVIQPTQMKLLPREKNELPSPSLGWYGGGRIQVDSQDPVKAVESFFEVRMMLEPQTDLRLLHGRTAEVRIPLKPVPVMTQLWRFLLQLFQKRYQF